MTDKVPENSDAHNPPETLTITYECGECGRNDFDSSEALGRHTSQCGGADEDADEAED